MLGVTSFEASASANSDATPGSLVAASRMEDVFHASTGEPCSGS
jgi:hypothetical protein